MVGLGGGPEGPNGPRHVTPIGSMYGIYANIGGILMVNVTIYSIHGSYGTIFCPTEFMDRMASEKHGRAVLRSSLPAVRDCVFDLKDFGHFGRVGNGYWD